MKQRIISAIIAINICVPLIIYGGTVFYLAVALLGIIGFYEILKLREKKKKVPSFMKILSLILFILIMMDGWGLKNGLLDLKNELVFIIFFIILPVVFYNDKEKYNIDDAFYLIGSILFLGIGFNTLANIRILSFEYFIYILVVVIMTDTFAYFTGYFIGKNKLCPKISPNKTWEGFIGGLIFGSFTGVMILNSLLEINSNIYVLIVISIILSITGQIGDMVFSSIKRYYGIKDFGNIMPGHGGVLDRLDSLLFVCLVFTYLSKFI